MVRIAVAVLITALGFLRPVATARQVERLDPEVTEQVEVRLVLVDTLVVDRSGRTVPDLTRDDFELFVDYDPMPIDTLDVSCPAGAAEDPRSVGRLGDVRPPVAPGVERRIVLAVDYMHLGQIGRVDVIERMRDMIEGADPSAEEIMIAAVTGDLRVEQTFSGDRRQILDTLERVENDISLWLPPFDHLHELRFFRSLDRLVDLLSLVPGSKAVVLFSNFPGPSASYDLAFERLASKSTHARVAFYPVLARGLSRVSSPRLARLAVETGGRFTENTNDLSLGYARAQRDLTCRYVLGFYDRNPERGKARRVSVRVLRDGARAMHSNNYEFPTPDEERESRMRSALIAPGMFSGTAVKTRFYPLRPVGSRRWDGLVAVEFPAAGETWQGGEALRDVSVSLRRGNHVEEEVTRRVGLRDRPVHSGATDRSSATHLERLVVRPGEYVLTAAVSDPDLASPAAARAAFTLPPVPRDGLFVVPPILGHRPAGRIELQDDAAPPGPRLPDFQPLLESRVAPGQALVTMTHACRSGRGDSQAKTIAERTLRSSDGTLVVTLEPTTPAWSAGGRLACVRIVDELPTADLAAGDYAFDVTLRQGDLRVSERLRFSVGPLSPPP